MKRAFLIAKTVVMLAYLAGVMYMDTRLSGGAWGLALGVTAGMVLGWFFAEKVLDKKD